MKTRNIFLAVVVIIVTTACGGGGSGDTPYNGELVDAETGELKNNAVSAIGSSFDGNFGTIGKILNRNSEVLTGTLIDITAASNTNDSTTIRTGNRITVDPDEVELCLDDNLFGAADPQDFTDCQALLKDLTVELIASSEQGGVLTYFFKGQPVVRLGYETNSESVELDFGGLKTLLNSASIISDGDELADLPSKMTGSMRFSTVTTNSTRSLQRRSACSV